LIVVSVVFELIPLILDVIVFEFVEVETDNTLLLMIFATVEEIPLIITCNRLLLLDATTVLITVDVPVVEVFPFTTEVKENPFVEVAIDKLLVVDDATRFVRSVVVETPFTEVVRLLPLVDRLLLLITVVVAITPFTFVVSTFPVTLCVNELMMLVTADEIPLIIVWNRLPLDDAVAELMIVEVATTPFTALVSMFVAEDNEFVVVDTKPAIDVVETTPFILEVTTPPA
jgi:hypothetical protein